MALISLPFPLFVNGTASDGGQITSDFSTIVNAINGNLDNTNIGAAGIFASQIKAGSSLQATFTAASIGFTFLAGATSITPLSATSIASASAPTGIFDMGTTQSVDGLQVNGAASITGNIFAAYLASGGTNVFKIASSGGAVFNPPAGSGVSVLSAASSSAGTFFVGMGASQSGPGLLVNGAASVTGNLLQVDLTSGGSHVVVVSPAGILQLNGSGLGGAVGDFAFGRSASTAFAFWGTSSTTAGRADFGATTAGTYSFMVDPTAPTYAPVNGGAYTNASDAAFKSDVMPIEDGLREIMALKPSSFVVRNTGKPGLGFIAQEVRDVLPILVSEDGNGMLGVNYDGIIPVLVKAFQDYVLAHP